jgi:hypothetical protein
MRPMHPMCPMVLKMMIHSKKRISLQMASDRPRSRNGYNKGFQQKYYSKNRSSRFYNRKLILAIIIVLVSGLTFGLWFFFISNSDNAIDTSENFLPPNCYSINGREICPSPKS